MIELFSPEKPDPEAIYVCVWEDRGVAHVNTLQMNHEYGWEWVPFQCESGFSITCNEDEPFDAAIASGKVYRCHSVVDMAVGILQELMPPEQKAQLIL